MRIIFSTGTNAMLARTLSRLMGIRLGECVVGYYPDREVSVRIMDAVEGKDVIVVGSTFPPAEHALGLFMLIHTARLHGARSVSVVAPYFAYGKSDRIRASGDSVSAGLMADMFACAGATRLFTLSLHSTFVHEQFSFPLIELSPVALLADAFKRLRVRNAVVASPDEGGAHRAREFAAWYGVPDIITVAKVRKTPRVVRVTHITGNVRGKNVVLVDDMVQTGDTLLKAARALRREGAEDIYVAVAHAVQTGPGILALARAREIRHVITTDTIPFVEKIPAKFEVVSVAKLIADELMRG